MHLLVSILQLNLLLIFLNNKLISIYTVHEQTAQGMVKKV